MSFRVSYNKLKHLPFYITDGASRVEFSDLLSEYTLLKEVDHPNVIRLIGAATLNGPFHLVVEYCEHGSLKNYLRNIRIQEPIYVNGATQFYRQHAEQLMSFSWQISQGMQYLSEIKVCFFSFLVFLVFSMIFYLSF